MIASPSIEHYFQALSSRSSAYFEQDGGRRGYTFQEPEDLDLLINDKLRDVTEREVKQKEEMEKKVVANALRVMKKATASKN